jgi:hypothetical protein
MPLNRSSGHSRFNRSPSKCAVANGWKAELTCEVQFLSQVNNVKPLVKFAWQLNPDLWIANQRDFMKGDVNGRFQ